MKISTRISIVYSLVSSAILVIFSTAIYMLESNHQKVDFQERLKDRVNITENFFLEKESFTAAEYEKIRTQFLHILPNETEEVIELKKGEQPVFRQHYSSLLKEKLVNNKNLSFEESDFQGESKLFQVNMKKYLIIVTAIDNIGNQNLIFLLSSVILLIFLGVPFIFIISFLVAKKSLLPLSKKIKHANSISASNLDQRLQIVNPNDEIGEMVIAFNRLLDRLEVAFKAQKAFISNASHEIKNPLTAIIGEAEVTISKTRTPKEYEESLSTILEEADTLNLTVNNLLQLSKVTALEKNVSNTKFALDDFLKETIESYRYQNPENKIELIIKKGVYIIDGNKNLLKTAVTNLFDNACKYSSNKKVEVILKIEKNNITITITDKGIGIPKAELEKIKEPFYRAKNTFQINGSGIGLSLSSKIITLHNGTMTILSEEGKGTEVIITLNAG